MRSNVAITFYAIGTFSLLPISSLAQTGAEAFNLGCGGGCHSSERKVLRAIPKGTDQSRRQWIVDFISQHPCSRDDLKPIIIDYLVERTKR